MRIFAMDSLSVDGNSQSMWPAYVAGNFFRLVGIKPALGRFILPSEGKVAGADPVLVLSYTYWKARFNGDPAIIGKKATVNGHPVVIVGVAPEGFHGLSSLMDFQGYMPLGMAATLKDAPANFLAARENAAVDWRGCAIAVWREPSGDASGSGRRRAAGCLNGIRRRTPR